MSSTDTIVSYIAKLEDIAHKLEVMGEKVSDNIIITKILMTLPHSYHHFVSAWESAAQIERTLENLTSRLAIEEMRHHPEKSPEENALFTRKSQRKKLEGKGRGKNLSRPGKCFHARSLVTG